MKEKVNSILIGLLLSFTILFVLCVVTLFNKNFYKHEFQNKNYYEYVYNKLNEEIKYCGYNDDSISISDVESDINYYIGSNFEQVDYFQYDQKVLNEIYNHNIKLRGFFDNNYNYIKIIVIVVMISLIIITFELYLNLNCEKYNFLFISGFIGLIINFVLYKSFYFDNYIIDNLYNKYMLFYLVINIFQIIYSIYLYFVLNTKNVKKR